MVAVSEPQTSLRLLSKPQNFLKSAAAAPRQVKSEKESEGIWENLEGISPDLGHFTLEITVHPYLVCDP